MATMRCTQCDGTQLEQGFVDVPGVGSTTTWIAGRLERGFFGGVRKAGRERWELFAFRCVACGHLELFANRPWVPSGGV